MYTTKKTVRAVKWYSRKERLSEEASLRERCVFYALQNVERRIIPPDLERLVNDAEYFRNYILYGVDRYSKEALRDIEDQDVKDYTCSK